MSIPHSESHLCTHNIHSCTCTHKHTRARARTHTHTHTHTSKARHKLVYAATTTADGVALDQDRTELDTSVLPPDMMGMLAEEDLNATAEADDSGVWGARARVFNAHVDSIHLTIDSAEAGSA